MKFNESLLILINVLSGKMRSRNIFHINNLPKTNIFNGEIAGDKSQILHDRIQVF
jgi:hypothetical protein